MWTSAPEMSICSFIWSSRSYVDAWMWLTVYNSMILMMCDGPCSACDLWPDSVKHRPFD
jgi:hypothetical protein